MRKQHVIGIASALVLLLITANFGQVSFPVPGNPTAPTASRTGPRWYEPSARTGVAIEAAIQTAFKNGGRVFLPGGTYLVGKTIDLTHIGPIVIEGEAPAMLDGWRGAGGVMLNWTGERGGTMFKMNTYGVQMRNLTLNGQNTGGTGVHLWSSDGWGTSFNSFDSVSFSGFTTAGVQAGLTGNDINAADTYFDRCWFSNSTTGFKVIHNQGLNYHFDRCYFESLDTAIQADRGGAIHIRGGGAVSCDTILRSGEGGHNTGPLTIRDFRFEHSGRNVKWGRLVDAPDSIGGTQIVIDGVRFASGADVPKDVETETLRIGSNVSVHVTNSVLKRPGNWPLARVTGKPGNPAVLRIESSDFPGDVIDPAWIIQNSDARVKIMKTFD